MPGESPSVFSRSAGARAKFVPQKSFERGHLSLQRSDGCFNLPGVLQQALALDLIRQGDNPSVSVLVTSGIVARYHLLPNGKRQYLSFHLTGDMPDSQALFIEEMDHAVCAIGPASVALIEHKDLLSLFKRRPSVSFAIWRETLIDAAIFREAITNNSARTRTARMAHLFCELYYRAKASGLAEDGTLFAPISLVQLGETLGMSIATVNRTLNELRKSRTVEFYRGVLSIKSWDRLAKIVSSVLIICI